MHVVSNNFCKGLCGDFLCNSGYHISFTLIAAGPPPITLIKPAGISDQRIEISWGLKPIRFTQNLCTDKLFDWLVTFNHYYFLFFFALFGHQMVHLFPIIYIQCFHGLAFVYEPDWLCFAGSFISVWILPQRRPYTPYRKFCSTGNDLQNESETFTLYVDFHQVTMDVTTVERWDTMQETARVEEEEEVMLLLYSFHGGGGLVYSIKGSR